MLRSAAERAVHFLNDDGAVNATVDAETLRNRFYVTLPAQGRQPEDVVDHLCSAAEGGLLRSNGGRFFAWVIGGTLPSALAADWLTAAWDQNAALYACSPAAAIVEEAAGAWLKELLALPQHATFAFVTGCQMAHVTCLAAARHALLAKHGWDVERNGLFGAPRVRVISSDRRHASIDRALRMLGFGSESLVLLEPDVDETLEPGAVEEALAFEPQTPKIVLLQAGDINTGAFDRFDRVIPIAKRYGAWVHVDGAFGLWAAASERYAHLTRGVDGADSWATDGHKWLNVPFDSGYAFVADAESHRAAMSIRAPYITAHAQARDQIDWNPEWSRRARGFATYAALLELGRDGVAATIDGSCAQVAGLVEQLERLPNVEVLWRPLLNQGLVRFLDPRPNASDGDHDNRTEDVIARVVDSGEGFFGATTWRGKRAMRISNVSAQTTDGDVRRVVEAFRAALTACELAPA
ncbi:MAG: aspartate aminotransferase family protein [Candidatus Eremiobacteraeota bacterium]|nr:aspartate aminotransferase family protein [Candidatus Eremiobacteraeota bacterium]